MMTASSPKPVITLAAALLLVPEFSSKVALSSRMLVRETLADTPGSRTVSCQFAPTASSASVVRWTGSHFGTVPRNVVTSAAVRTAQPSAGNGGPATVVVAAVAPLGAAVVATAPEAEVAAVAPLLVDDEPPHAASATHSNTDMTATAHRRSFLNIAVPHSLISQH